MIALVFFERLRHCRRYLRNLLQFNWCYHLNYGDAIRLGINVLQVKRITVPGQIDAPFAKRHKVSAAHFITPQAVDVRVTIHEEREKLAVGRESRSEEHTSELQSQ